MAKQERIVHVKVTSNVNSVNKEVGKTSKSTKGLAGGLKSVGAAASMATGGIRAMTTALLSSGVGAIVVALGAFVSIMRSALMESMEFSKSLSGLEAVTAASSEEMDKFSKEAKRLGASTAFTASQVVELQTEFAKLGFTTDEILNVTEATLDLAAAAGTDLANAATVAGSTLRGFGLDSSETGRVADVMAKSFSSSALDIEKFQESMKLVAPIAKTVKVDIEKSSAALSVLADAGISGSMAGTQLRRVMTDLAMKTGKDFQTSLKMTQERLQGASSDADRLSIAKELVGQRAASTLLILSENGEKLQDLEKDYRKAAGSAKEMAEVRLDNLAGDVTILKSAWSGMLLSIEDGEGLFNKIARGAVKSLTNAITSLTNGIEFAGFTFSYYFGNDVNETESGMSRRQAIILRTVASIKQAFAEFKLFIADIPFLGRNLDKSKIEQDLDNAKKLYKKFNDDVKDIEARNAEDRAKKKGFWAEWETHKKAVEMKKTQALENKLNEEFIEGSGDSVDKELEQEAAKREKFRNQLKTKEEDFEDQTELEKIERKRERHLAELDTLGFNETEKNELIKSINDYYDGLAVEQFNKDMDEADKLEAQDKERKEKKTQEDLERAERERKAKLQMQLDVFDNAARIAGEETKLGKAMLVAKQLLMAKELYMSAKNAIIEAKIKAAQSTGEVTKGFAKANATLNPFVIASYAVSAAGIITSIASAFKASKKASQAAGVSGGGSLSTQTQAPSFNVVGQQTAGEQAIGSRLEALQGGGLKAYVVEEEITNAQQNQGAVNDAASLG